MGSLTTTITSFIKSIWQRKSRQIDQGMGDIETLRPGMDMGTAAMVASGDMNAIQNYLGLDNDLLSRYIDYEDMDDYPDCSTTLDIHSDDATIIDNRENKTLWVQSPDEQVRSTLDDLFNKRIKIDESSWGDIRTLCKYGNCYNYILLGEDGVAGLKNMPPATMTRVEGVTGEDIGFMQSFSSNYNVDYNYFKDGQHWEAGVASSGGVNLFRDWRMVHMRLLSRGGDSLYGHSILESSRYIWKRLILLEDAALIYRLTRSPSRFGFYIDVGKNSPEKARKILQKFKQEVKKKKFVNPRTGKLDLRYNPLSVDEDFFLPVYDGNEKVRVDTLSEPSWQCLHGDTIIPLLNGDRVSLRELAEKHNGKDLWVYSMNEKGDIVPGRARNPRVTKRKKIWKVKLDNGAVVRCSDNHPWMLRDMTYCRTDKLHVGEKMMPWCANLKCSSTSYYERVYNPSDGMWVYTHRLVAQNIWQKQEGKDSLIVHHKDGNGTNNYPNNLEFMSRDDHASPHLIERWGRACCKVKQKYMYQNHVVIDVEETDEWVDMYDITVEDHHNFAIEAGVFVHNSMDDIEYFRNKLHAALSVPRAYLGYDENQPSRATLSQESVRFARKVLRIQREYRNGCKKVADVHLAAKKIDPYYTDFEIRMSAPNSIFELAQLEVEQARSSFARDMESYVSSYWILSKIFGLSDEEIAKVTEQRKQDKIREVEQEAAAEAARGDDSGGMGGRFDDRQIKNRGRKLMEGNRDHERRMEDNMEKIMKGNSDLARRIKDLNGLLQELKYFQRRKG